MRPIDILKRRHVTGGGGGGGPPPGISVPAGTYNHLVIDPADATCTITFNPSGSCSVSAGVTPSSPPNWRTGPGAGADYDISFDGGGSWANLSVARSSSVNRNGIGVTAADRDTRIRPAGGGATLATGIIRLEAEVDG